MFNRRFRKARNGVKVSLPLEEADLLRQLPAQLREILETEGTVDDPALERLFPRAYLDPTEEEAEGEWQSLVHSELLAGKLAALDLLAASLADDRATEKGTRVQFELTDEDTESWLNVLNDLRLTLGTRLHVTEDPNDRPDPQSDAAPAWALYDWLTMMQGELLDALMG